jgi:hypothetical protein
MASSFAHRTLTGWISEFINRPLPGGWPQIPMDDETLSDLEAHFDLCRESGYNEVVIWGFFVGRDWPLDITSCLDEDRRARIRRVIHAAHARDLSIHSGLGIYSWGFDEIIRANPHLSRGNPHAMCPSVPESRAWMEKVTDFVLGSFEFDGLNMQSADQGRCSCDDCRDLPDVEYHARLNTQTADYIHARWPGKLLIMDNWGCPFGDPELLPHLVTLSKRVGYIVDHDNSAARGAGRDYRRKLIGALACPFGTLAGKSVWPPQRWPVDKWFLPTTLMNVGYMRELHDDGGRAAEQFVTKLANPSGEVSLRFMGGLLSDVGAGPQQLLCDAVERTYRPRDARTRDGLAEVIAQAEQAYFGHSGRELSAFTGLVCLNGGLMPGRDPSPETYLLDMPTADLAAYAAAVSRLSSDFERLRPGIGDEGKAELTARAFQSVLADVHRVRGTPKAEA